MGRRVEAGGGGPASTAAMMLVLDFPSNARAPVSIS